MGRTQLNGTLVSEAATWTSALSGFVGPILSQNHLDGLSSECLGLLGRLESAGRF